jgi:hypothetical protein
VRLPTSNLGTQPQPRLVLASTCPLVIPIRTSVAHTSRRKLSGRASSGSVGCITSPQTEAQAQTQRCIKLTGTVRARRATKATNCDTSFFTRMLANNLLCAVYTVRHNSLWTIPTQCISCRIRRPHTSRAQMSTFVFARTEMASTRACVCLSLRLSFHAASADDRRLSMSRVACCSVPPLPPPPSQAITKRCFHSKSEPSGNGREWKGRKGKEREAETARQTDRQTSAAAVADGAVRIDRLSRGRHYSDGVCATVGPPPDGGKQARLLPLSPRRISKQSRRLDTAALSFCWMRKNRCQPASALAQTHRC